ncbi:alpha/beta hydrolase [Treponema sp. Marseille-Q4523]|uniref:alpha/beta hydrolase n=1 Tax=Treponema sp. Marseille-Q4523 TaxID=2810610 RepID=UPI001960F228|nr:alpha/beta hydrolase [Treponema sp. Marseille-Q4523]MBM7021912.1 alpha/beta hydrolase [Treponema sp. Marseille-Q4523]
MASIQYKLTKFLFKSLVRPMMKKAAADPEKFLQEQYKARQKKKLALSDLHKKYDFDEKTAGGIPYYAVHSRDKNCCGTGAQKKLVLYFFGGGFVMSGDAGDFDFAQDMADQTGADVWIVWYKLFPETTGKELIESIIGVYKEALGLYEAKDIAFFGLSSGGSLCLDICAYITEQKIALPLPGKLIPFSATIQMPPTSAQLDDMKRIAKKDAMFTAEYVEAASKMMSLCGALGFLGNSVAYSWRGFPRIAAFYGTDEIYYAELDAFKQKCEADGVALETHIGKGMMHTWAAAPWLPEAKEARKIIYSYVKEN